MYNYIAGTRNEWSKLAARKKLLLSIGLIIALPIASAVLLSQLQTGVGIAAVSSNDFPIRMLGIYTAFILPLIIFMAAADVFAGEIQDRTLKLTLIRPISRISLFTAKLSALALFSLMSLAIGCVASLLSGLFLQSQPYSSWGTSLLQVLEAYSVAFLPMLTLTVFAALIAQLFRNASGALMICVCIYAGLKLAGFFLPHYAALTPVFYTDWHQLWLNGAVPARKIVLASMTLMASCILCFTAAFAMFDRREL
jgi:ABC-2 type transport system permease protein